MKKIEMSNATPPLAHFAEQAQSEPVIVTVHGKPIAAVVPIDNADIETASLSTDPQFLALIERSRVRRQQEGSISPEEMRRRLGL